MLFGQDIPAQSPNLIVDGKKEEDWVIWFDKNFNEISERDSVHYYRKVTFQKDIPVGMVRDYYKSGAIQWEGRLLSIEPDFNDGECKWFYESGQLSTKRYFRDGLKQGEEITYFENENHCYPTKIQI